MADLIDRQAALDAVHKSIFDFFDICDDDEESPMTYKDEWLLELNKAIATQIKATPSTDAIEVVRCWNCVWWDNCPSSTITPNFHKCKRVGRMSMPSDGFCSYGERRDGRFN